MLCQIAFQVVSLQRLHENYPWRVFTVLSAGDSRQKAQKMKFDQPCRFDAWTQELLNTYDALDSDDCLADLAGTMLMHEVEMASVEAGHSGVRRCIYSHSCHCPQVAAQSTNADWIMRKVRTLSTKLGQSKGKAPGKKNEAAQGTPRGRLGKRRGGGGPWMAFIRDKVLGMKASDIDMTSLSVEYHALNADQKASYAAAGAVATALHRQGSSKAFGATSREAERAHRKRALEAEVQSMCDAPGDQGADPHGRRKAICLMSQQAAAQGSPESSSWGRLRVFKEALALERQADLQHQRAMQGRLVAFQEGRAQAIVSAACDELGSLKARSGESEACSSSSSKLVALRWTAVDIPRRVREALKLQPSLHASQSLRNRLASTWHRVNMTTQTVEMPVLAKVAPKEVARPCQQAGRCICSGMGKVCKDFANRLRALVVKACAPNSAEQVRLQQAEIAICLVGLSKEQVDKTCAPDLPPPQIRLLHIGTCSLSPWRLMFEVLEVKGAFAIDPMDAKPPPRIQARFTGDFVGHYDFDSFDLSLSWGVSVYGVVFEERMVPWFVPCEVTLERLATSSSFVPFWTPWSRRRRRTQAPTGWARLLDPGFEDAAHEAEVEEDAAFEEAANEEGEVEEEAVGAAQSDGGSHDDSSSSSSERSGGAESEVDLQEGVGAADGADSESDRSVAELVDQVLAQHDPAPPPSPPPPPPDVPQAVVAPALRGPRQGGETIRVPASAGMLVAYSYSRMGALCRLPGHVDCKKERVLHAGRNRAQGRPLVFLHWWLSRGFDHATAEQHLRDTQCSFQDRVEARANLHAVAGAEELFHKERPQRDDGEGSEPERCP